MKSSDIGGTTSVDAWLDFFPEIYKCAYFIKKQNGNTEANMPNIAETTVEVSINKTYPSLLYYMPHI